MGLGYRQQRIFTNLKNVVKFENFYEFQSRVMHEFSIYAVNPAGITLPSRRCCQLRLLSMLDRRHEIHVVCKNLDVFVFCCKNTCTSFYNEKFEKLTEQWCHRLTVNA